MIIYRKSYLELTGMKTQKDFKNCKKAAMFIVPQSPPYIHTHTICHLKLSSAKFFTKVMHSTATFYYKNC